MLTDLLSYIELKKPTLLRFYRELSFLFIIVIGSKGSNILKISKIPKTSKNPRYNKFSIIY